MWLKQKIGDQSKSFAWAAFHVFVIRLFSCLKVSGLHGKNTKAERSSCKGTAGGLTSSRWLRVEMCALQLSLFDFQKWDSFIPCFSQIQVYYGAPSLLSKTSNLPEVLLQEKGRLGNLKSRVLGHFKFGLQITPTQ